MKTRQQSPGRDHVAGDGEILTFSGRYVTPLDLQPEQVCIEDIAHALSNQCRYSGHTIVFYSVAQHSVLVADLLRDLTYDLDIQLQGLMHDAAEAYLQDMARPLKEDKHFGKAYRAAERTAEKAVCKALSIPYPFHDVVKGADLAMLGAERRDLMPQNGRWSILDGVEIPWDTVVPWTPSYAKCRFLDAYGDLTHG